mgnify:CR=1 FL=1
MMQSCEPESHYSSSPQIYQKKNVLKSAELEESAGVSQQIEGDTLYQIFETKEYIFKLLSTLEEMYRYRFDPNTNEVIERVVFKRVKKGDSVFAQLCCIKPKRKNGKATVHDEIEYKIYVLVSEGCLKGYILSYKDAETEKIKHLYFVREK